MGHRCEGRVGACCSVPVNGQRATVPCLSTMTRWWWRSRMLAAMDYLMAA